MLKFLKRNAPICARWVLAAWAGYYFGGVFAALIVLLFLISIKDMQ